MERREGAPVRQFAAALALLVSACGSVAPTTPAAQSRFIGGVVADEPRAALVGLAALKDGGTAADAAAATFFALSVTYPLAAGIAGGGTCLSYDAVTGTSESIDFTPGAAALGGSVALPGSVRGIAAVHSRFGRLRWSQVVLPAEEMARFGFSASRALAVGAGEYVRATGSSDLGPFISGGQAISEGAEIQLPALADVLSIIRTKGSGDLYFGSLGQELIVSAQRVGGRLTLDDMREYLPGWERSRRASFGDLSFYTASSGPTGAMITSAIWSMVTDQNRYFGTDEAGRAHLLIEASWRAFSEAAKGGEDLTPFRAAALMSDYQPARHLSREHPDVPDLSPWLGAGRDGATGFVALDAAGSAVACVVTMNAPFGNGVWSPRLGIFLAPSIPGGPDGWLQGGTDLMVPAVVANAVTGELVTALTATGGPAAPPTLVAVAARSILDVAPLSEAINAPRVVGLPVPDVAAYERGVTAGMLDALRSAGHRLVEAENFAIVNGILCFGGATLDPTSCGFVPDGRSFGLGDGGMEF